LLEINIPERPIMSKSDMINYLENLISKVTDLKTKELLKKELQTLKDQVS